MAMIMLISGVDGFVVERDILASTMRREMMGSSIKNSNVEVTISRNPDGNDLYDAQSSHKGLTKSTGVTGHKKGLLCQGLSFDEVQVQYDENEVGLISVTRESEAGGAVIDASATLTNIGVSITNDNDNVGSKTHNATSSSPMTSEVLSDSLFNAGKLSSHQLNVDILSGLQFNVGNLSSYHLKVGDLSQSHVHKLSDSHASLASSSSDDDLSLLDSQALLPFELSGLSNKCDNLSLSSPFKLSGLSTKCDDLSLSFKCDDLSLLSLDSSITGQLSVILSTSDIISWTLCLISQLYTRLV
jgi:hypothetical protein